MMTACTGGKENQLPGMACIRRVIVNGCLFVGIAVLLNACAAWPGKPTVIQYDSDATRALINRLTAMNSGLKAISGKGRVVVSEKGAQHVYNRTVWVGAEPGRLRFAFRSPAGMPVFSMSCDEQWVTALQHADGKYYRRHIGDNSLSSFLPVEINCRDLYGLLVGRLPRVTYDKARTDASDNQAGDTIAILLQRQFRGTVGRIRVSRATGELRTVELMDIHGNRRYAAEVDHMQTVGGYRLPGHIALIGPDGSLELDVQEVRPRENTSADLFRIEPPVSN